MKVIQATEETLPLVAKLFDLYRQFYQQPEDLSAATAFISARLIHKDSVIYVAVDNDNKGMGFTQLFPGFSSVAMRPIYILNDLFVHQDHRRKGAARVLMNTARAFAEKNKAHGIKLVTAIDNHQAKALYDQLGYKKIDSFDYYTLKL